MSTTAGLKAVHQLSLNKNIVYAGGEHNPKQPQHNKHWENVKISYRLKDPPANKDHCVCHHGIKWNCYIFDTDKRFLTVVGNCCIKKFTGGKMRICDECGASHKTQKWNKCKDCKPKYTPKRKTKRIPSIPSIKYCKFCKEEEVECDYYEYCSECYFDYIN